MEAHVSQEFKAQAIQPSNALRDKVGGRTIGLDPNMLARAEAALKSLSGQFSQWLNDEIVKLETARTEIQAKGLNGETGEALYMRAHDLKGLGGTYEFPIITRLAGSLCQLLDDPEKRSTAPMYLVDAHIHAIKAAVRDNIRDDSNPVGRALAEALEAQVRAYFS
jgi:chemotaxis protein histidine kinase CheA